MQSEVTQPNAKNQAWFFDFACDLIWAMKFALYLIFLIFILTPILGPMIALTAMVPLGDKIGSACLLASSATFIICGYREPHRPLKFLLVSIGAFIWYYVGFAGISMV